MRKLIFASLLSLGGLAAKGQIPQPDPDTTAKHFLTIASIGNLQEISAAQLATQKGTRADVKSFAKMMIMDHQQAQAKLVQIAKSVGISLPASATGGIQPDLMLKNAGASFDRLYVHAMVVNHANTVETFENYATTGKNPDVKAFAQQTLPTLKHHLEEIKAIDAQITEVAK